LYPPESAQIRSAAAGELRQRTKTGARRTGEIILPLAEDLALLRPKVADPQALVCPGERGDLLNWRNCERRVWLPARRSGRGALRRPPHLRLPAHPRGAQHPLCGRRPGAHQRADGAGALRAHVRRLPARAHGPHGGVHPARPSAAPPSGSVPNVYRAPCPATSLARRERTETPIFSGVSVKWALLGSNQ
jgi:hypothetical protein